MNKRVWNQRRPFNYPKQIEMAGGYAAPLLAVHVPDLAGHAVHMIGSILSRLGVPG